jgi:hypothetical protein
MRYRIIGHDASSGSPVEPFFVDADDEEEARSRAAELGTVVERVEEMPHGTPAPRNSASNNPRRQIPPERRALYYAGGILALIGLILFISVFFTGAANFGNFDHFHERGQSMALRAISGMVLMIIGGIIANIGAKGLAGAGVVLDPEKARADVEPWSRMAGGVVQDALAEVDVVKKVEERLEAPAPEVKVRCRKCHALNEESAKFCNQCGSAM